MTPAESALACSGVRRIFSYDSETGSLKWVKPTGKRAVIGVEAGWVSAGGYRRVKIGGVQFCVHRVIYAHVTESWPVDQIDHVDGDPSNNKWANLRPATLGQNMKNVKLRATNATGLKGITPWYRKWRSVITSDKKRIDLGLFDCPAAAHLAYAVAADRLHGDFVRKVVWL